MEVTRRLLEDACSRWPRYAVAVSGGVDSTILLDLACRLAPVRPMLAVFAETGMEPSDTRPFVEDLCRRYEVKLACVSASETPEERWTRTGFPIGGKQASDVLMRGAPELGWKLSCRSCCRALKTRPARRIARALGAQAMWSGVRGAADSNVRGTQALQNGAVIEPSRDTGQLALVAPMLGWTDAMGRRYMRLHSLPINPGRARGQETGCQPCGGGAQHTTSGIRRTRLYDPPAFKRWVLQTDLGLALLAVRFRRTVAQVKAAVELAGGLDRLPPHVFDFIRRVPIAGSEKVSFE